MNIIQTQSAGVAPAVRIEGPLTIVENSVEWDHLEEVDGSLTLAGSVTRPLRALKIVTGDVMVDSDAADLLPALEEISGKLLTRNTDLCMPKLKVLGWHPSWNRVSSDRFPVLESFGDTLIVSHDLQPPTSLRWVEGDIWLSDAITHVSLPKLIGVGGTFDTGGFGGVTIEAGQLHVVGMPFRGARPIEIDASPLIAVDLIDQDDDETHYRDLAQELFEDRVSMLGEARQAALMIPEDRDGQRDIPGVGL